MADKKCAQTSNPVVREGAKFIDDIAIALEAIRYKAQDIQNCINVVAENVGCNYIDEDERRRWNARSASRQ